MAHKTKKSIVHFTHPGHMLTLVDHHRDYLCDACLTPGHGRSFYCRGCDFYLHEGCAICPRKLSSFLHPDHPLRLVTLEPKSRRQGLEVVICDICTDQVEGIYYRCDVCEFDVHPLCTQLPPKLNHVLHRTHALVLRAPRRCGPCAVCGDSCRGWRYRCVECNFDIHLDCILAWVQRQNRIGPTNQHPNPRFNGRAHSQLLPQFRPYYGPTNQHLNPRFDGRAHSQLPPQYYGPTNQRQNPRFGGRAHSQPPPQFGPCYGPTNQRQNLRFNERAHSQPPPHSGPCYGPIVTAPQNYYHASSSEGSKRRAIFQLVAVVGVAVISEMIFGDD